MLKFELRRPVGAPQMIQTALGWSMHQPTEMVCGVEASDINDAIDRFRQMYEVQDLVVVDLGVDSADVDLLIVEGNGLEVRRGWDMGVIRRA